MKILLEELPHQLDAIEKINNAFKGIDHNAPNNENPNYVYANPLIKGRYIEENNIDVKMETGTGKTYVGVRTMYELHKNHGIFKFIIVVPSPAIKEGWKKFLTANYAKQHFSQFYENTQIEVDTIDAGDFKSKSGRKNMPAKLTNFIEGSRLNSTTINVLLINDKMLTSKSMTKEYDQTLLSGFTKPIEGIQATRPVVILDEPHRFPRVFKKGKWEGKVSYNKVESLNPQTILRLGATFSENNKRRDYYRKNGPVVNLNSIKAFNDGLIKGIDVIYPSITEAEAKNKLKVKSAGKQLTLTSGNTEYVYSYGDEIGVDGGIFYEGNKLLSNGLELEKGMEILPSTMTSSYQEKIIQNAIDKHFEIEIDNFMRENDNQAKVKTISLFFIDSIKSYRDKDGWLKEVFEKLLQKKVNSLIRQFEFKKSSREQEYLSFLRATNKDLQTNVHAGYFGEDRSNREEAIQAEVDDILKNKERLLSFKDEKGNWQTRRFLFSKWTLREGWDNPNVFVIAKLRTSGSENSKTQEVGRGLRLPVDENGHRLQQNELPSRLSFLIGYDEKEFASKLVSEVNADKVLDINEDHLTDDVIKLIIKNEDIKEVDLLGELVKEDIINFDKEFQYNGFKKLMEKYPFINENTSLQPGKITDNKPDSQKRVKLNKNNWNKMRGLWEKFSNRYMLEFKRVDPDVMENMIKEVMEGNNFEFQYLENVSESFVYDKEELEMDINKQIQDDENRKPIEGMIYGQFLIRLSKDTKLQPNQLHRELIKVLNNKYKNDNRYLNEITLSNLSRDFKKRFENKYAQNYTYKELDFKASTSVFDSNTDDFKDSILANIIGINTDNNVDEDDRQLYEVPPIRYDSANPEKELLKYGYNSSVIAFGKLPKKAIQIPRYTGGTTTPDFVYIVEKDDKSQVYLLVETKAEGSAKRGSDEQIVATQRKFFDSLKDMKIEYKEASKPNDVYSALRKLVEKDV